MVLFTLLRRTCVGPDYMGPNKFNVLCARKTMDILPDAKHWYCGGYRTAAIAAELIKKGKIIAIPTDTIYGLAGLAQDNDSIAKLYDIKKRDLKKPLAICLSDINEVSQWAHDENLPEGLVDAILPGPTTIILKRKSCLNPSLNQGVENVGIRIPKFDFVRSVVKMLKQPIALTSANESNQRSTLHPSEFKDLWPKVDGIFYDRMNVDRLKDSWRKGSTVVDLTVSGKFKVIRAGISYSKTKFTLKEFGLKPIFKDKDVKAIEDCEIEENSNETSDESDDEKEAKTASCW